MLVEFCSNIALETYFPGFGKKKIFCKTFAKQKNKNMGTNEKQI
jgi:hypothetical protein